MPQRTERNPPSLPAPPKGIDIWGKASPAWHRTTLNNLLPSPPSRAFLYGGKQRSRSQRMMPHAREREGQPRTRISVQRDEPTPVLVHTVPTPTACHSKASFNNAWLVCVRLACLLRVSFVDLTGVLQHPSQVTCLHWFKPTGHRQKHDTRQQPSVLIGTHYFSLQGLVVKGRKSNPCSTSLFRWKSSLFTCLPFISCF